MLEFSGVRCVVILISMDVNSPRSLIAAKISVFAMLNMFVFVFSCYLKACILLLEYDLGKREN